jgi:hypothetical protein
MRPEVVVEMLEGVDVIVDLPNSAVALAVGDIVRKQLGDRVLGLAEFVVEAARTDELLQVALADRHVGAVVDHSEPHLGLPLLNQRAGLSSCAGCMMCLSFAGSRPGFLDRRLPA